MLRVSGEWVSPAEVESVLIEHRAVLEAAVVGQRDELGRQRPVAYITLAPAHEIEGDELIEFCRARLAGYKCPRSVLFVDELPKTTTGKIQRYRLRSDLDAASAGPPSPTPATHGRRGPRNSCRILGACPITIMRRGELHA